jgi:hypothetical protein
MLLLRTLPEGRVLVFCNDDEIFFAKVITINFLLYIYTFERISPKKGLSKS